MMTTLKRHWLAIVLALITALLLFGFVSRCSAHRSRNAGAGGTPASSNRSLNAAPNTAPATPTTTPAWLASLDWEAIGMGVGGLLSGIATLYQIILKWRAGAVGVSAVIDQTKLLFGDADEVKAAFKSPVAKMDKPVTMERPTP